MRRLAIAALGIVLLVALALGVMEAERARELDPPRPIAGAHGAAIARPMLSSARADGWRVERRGRVALRSDPGERVVLRRIRFEDRTHQCVRVIATVSGQFAITDLSFAEHQDEPPDHAGGDDRARLAMNGSVCHFWPLTGGARTAMTGSWSLPFSAYEEHPGPDVLWVRAIALGTGAAPRTGRLELTFLRRPSEPTPGSLEQGPELARSLVRPGPRTVSIERGVVYGVSVLFLGAFLVLGTFGTIAFVRRARRRNEDDEAPFAQQ